MADFWGGVAKGFASSYESARERREREELREREEKREREQLEGTSKAYRDLVNAMRKRSAQKTQEEGIKLGYAQEREPYTGKLTGAASRWEEPGKPLVTPAEGGILPTLEEDPSRSDLIRGSVFQKAQVDLLKQEMADRKAAAIRDQAMLHAEKLQGTYAEKSAAAMKAAKTKADIAADLYKDAPAQAARTEEAKKSVEWKEKLPKIIDAGITIYGQPYMLQFMKDAGERSDEMLISNADKFLATAKHLDAFKYYSSELEKLDPKAAKDFQIVRDPETNRLQITGMGQIKPEEIAAKTERLTAIVKGHWARQDKALEPKEVGTPTQRQLEAYIRKANPKLSDAEVAREALEMASSGMMEEIFDDEGNLLIRRQPATGRGAGKGPPKAGPALTQKQQEALDLSLQTIVQADSFMAEFGEDAAQNLTVLKRFEHGVKNIGLPALGINNWADPRMAEWRAAAERLSKQAMSAMHKSMGGGMMSVADVEMYKKAIPDADTMSPVVYSAKFKRWRDDLASAIKYLDTKSRIADMPDSMMEMSPFEVQRLLVEKDPKTKNPILDWRLMHLLSENSPNFKYKDGDPFDPWTFEDIKRLKDAGTITRPFAARWIEFGKIKIPGEK